MSKMPQGCNPKWKRWCIACCSSQLWLFPAALLGILILIEGVHTTAHLRMEQDVHGYCRQNAEHQENLSFGDDDW